jgi:hypothetical protein
VLAAPVAEAPNALGDRHIGRIRLTPERGARRWV